MPRLVIHNYFPIRDRALQSEFTSNDAWALAREIDPLQYLKGLSRVRLTPDEDHWNAAYDPNTDEIILQDKFNKKGFLDKVQTLLHEAGHRGQFKADPKTFQRFERLGLGSVKNFLNMANQAHRDDYARNGIENPIEEAFAESYARFALGLEMPEPLRKFWAARMNNA